LLRGDIKAESVKVVIEHNPKKSSMNGPKELVISKICNALVEFKNHLNYCFSEYYESDMRRKYYSPYFTVCQSSGYGKTRLSLECADEFIVFYICLRPKVT
jgi:hypothetical protein